MQIGSLFVGGEFPTRTFAAHRCDRLVVTPDVLCDRAVALQTPARMLNGRLNGTVLLLPRPTQSVAAVRSPGQPHRVVECPLHDLDRYIAYSNELPVYGDAMVAIDEIVVVIAVSDDKDGGKVFATPQNRKVVLHYARLEQS